MGIVQGPVVPDLEGGAVPLVGDPVDVEDELVVVGHLNAVAALGLVEEIR